MAANCNKKISKTQYTYVSKMQLNFVQFRMPNPEHLYHEANSKIQMHANIFNPFFNHSVLHSHGCSHSKRIPQSLTIWRVFQLFFVPTMVMVLNVCYFPLQKLLHLFGRIKSDIVDGASTFTLSHLYSVLYHNQ